ncbi:unnamed protein product [Auanema sp. JU1783]|nr:unnamed protein product [Auanema sp. JU1783]
MLNISRKGRSSVNVVNPIVQNLKLQKKFNHSNAPPRSSGGGGGKFLLGTTGLGLTGVSGVLLYSYVDPSFRANVESNFPFTKPLYKSILGDNSQALTLPTPVPSQGQVKPLSDSTPDTPKSKPVDIKKAPVKPVNPFVGPEDASRKNQSLEQQLKVAIANAEKKVRSATNAKRLTILSVERHVKSMKETIDKGPNAAWDDVVSAHKEAERKTSDDMEAEKLARIELQNLVKIINLGSEGETTAKNPLLSIAKETAAKFEKEIDEMLDMIKKIDTERVFIRDYGHLVEEGRKQFTSELKAIMPNANWDVELGKMKEDQVSALLLHAHLKVDQLNRQLVLQKMEEEKRVTELLEQKKLETINQVLESAKASGDDSELTSRLDTLKKDYDDELKTQLSVIEQTYDSRLKEVVLTQKQLYDIEHAKDLEEAVTAERSVHSAKFGAAISQLEGIEHALNSRVVQDAENRRSKQVWLAVQNLVDSITYGKRSSCCVEGRRLPLQEQLDHIVKHSTNDEFMNVLVNSISQESKVKGEYTTEDLKNRIEKAIRVSHRVAAVDENGGGLAAHVMSYIRSIFWLRLPVKYSDNDKFDPVAESNESLLDRAAYYARHGHLLEAVKVLQYVRGPAQAIAHDVVRDTRRHEETLLVARLMLAHAAVTSMRSTY